MLDEAGSRELFYSLHLTRLLFIYTALPRPEIQNFCLKNNNIILFPPKRKKKLVNPITARQWKWYDWSRDRVKWNRMCCHCAPDSSIKVNIISSRGKWILLSLDRYSHWIKKKILSLSLVGSYRESRGMPLTFTLSGNLYRVTSRQFPRIPM